MGKIEMIIKRDGRKEKFDLQKVINAITKAWLEVGNASDVKLIRKMASDIQTFVASISDNPTVEDIQDAVELKLADKHAKVAIAYAKYRTRQEIKRKAGWELSDLGKRIYEGKYRDGDESFEQFLDRTSGGNSQIRKRMLRKQFLFGGRILANRGLDKKGLKITLSNCYVLPSPEDNIESIYDTAKYMARTFSYGGGAGTGLNNLRPKDMKVNNSAKTTTGAVSFAGTYSDVGKRIGQNGRRGALMLSLLVSHPDIYDFINLKKDLTETTSANLSVQVLDAFMQAVEDNELWRLHFECKDSEDKMEKFVHAEGIYNLLCKNNWDMAEPGMLFWDTIQKWHLMSEVPGYKFTCTNPCLAGDTLIDTVNGRIPIEDLVGLQPFVYCMGIDGNLAIKQASKVWMTKKNAKVIKVVTAKGDIVCTPEHRIFTTTKGWIEAKDLKQGDKLKGLNRGMRNEKYVQVALTGGKQLSEHRFILEQFEDIDGKIVHHIDGDTTNNVLENLESMSISKHNALSNTGRKIEVIRDEKGRYVKKEFKKKKDSINLGKDGTNWYVQGIIELEELIDVYDMTVPEVHNFVANEIVVHNCGELPLMDWGACLLGSINLATMVKNPFTPEAEFDVETFVDVIHDAVIALNEVVDENIPLHPLQEQRDYARDYRAIGLGIMGLSDMLLQMGMQYGSDRAVNISKTIGFLMINEAVFQSALLAKEHGMFPKCNIEQIMASDFFKSNITPEIQGMVKQYGLYNAQLLAIAPTGSLSTMFDVSGGVEPIFMASYTRKIQSIGDEDEYFKVVVPVVEQFLKANPDLKEDDVKTATNLPFENRIYMQSAWQQFIDNAISSTINLPNHATVDDIKSIYMMAWKYGLKGVTIYRDGCARSGILSNHSKSEEIDNKEHCPDCKGEMIPQNGCKTCIDCGFSHCSV